MNTFLDIEIIIQGGIESAEDKELLRKLQIQSRKDHKERFLPQTHKTSWESKNFNENVVNVSRNNNFHVPCETIFR